MKIVYYSLSLAGNPSDQGRIYQLSTSLQSLRKHNETIHVQLHLFGNLPEQTQSLLSSLNVHVVSFPSYRALIEEHCTGLGDWLNLYPVLHKFLTMTALLEHKPTQVLYLDSDTYIHSDINELFETHQRDDLYAREEPGSRRSPLGYHPGYLNEDMLYLIAQKESCSIVNPFNTGVVLLNNKLWEQLLDITDDYLSFVIRISLWMEENNKGLNDFPDLAYLRDNMIQLKPYLANMAPIKFPGSNLWIKEQMALWLTVGRIKGVTNTCFERKYVTQGCEEIREPGKLEKPIVTHYYSQNTHAYMSQVNNPIYKSK